MPKTIYIPSTAKHSGISVEWTPTTGMISISGDAHEVAWTIAEAHNNALDRCLEL